MSNLQKTRFTFVVTALNCATSIEASLRIIIQAIDQLRLRDRSEIYVFDDGSTDLTFERAKQYVATLNSTKPRVSIYKNERALGMAANFRRGAKMSSAEVIVPAVGSNTALQETWVRLLEDHDGKGLTIGFREDLFQARPLAKAIASRVLNGWVLPIFGYRYRELSGYFAIPRQCLLDFVPADAGHGWFLYLVAGCEYYGIKVKEIWLPMNKENKSVSARFPNPKYAFKIFRALMNARAYVSRSDITLISN